MDVFDQRVESEFISLTIPPSSLTLASVSLRECRWMMLVPLSIFPRTRWQTNCVSMVLPLSI